MSSTAIETPFVAAIRRDGKSSRTAFLHRLRWPYSLGLVE